MRAEDSGTETEDLNGPEEHDELGTLFAAAGRLNSDDLGAADRFLAGQKTVQPVPGRAAVGGGKHRHAFRMWASAALGLAAAVSGLLVLRPAPTASPAELPASAAYSVYQSALGDGW